eukprot:1156888-Pelagomonas_calceolata.AAC.11
MQLLMTRSPAHQQLSANWAVAADHKQKPAGAEQPLGHPHLYRITKASPRPKAPHLTSLVTSFHFAWTQTLGTVAARSTSQAQGWPRTLVLQRARIGSRDHHHQVAFSAHIKPE